MSTKPNIITRPLQMDGEFFIHKEGTGRNRVRAVAFRTADGFVGVSKKWDRREAYDNALKVRAKAKAAAPAPHAAKPAPAAPLLHAMHDSDLCSELERRGYAVCIAEMIGLDSNGNDLSTGRPREDLSGISYHLLSAAEREQVQSRRWQNWSPSL